MHRANKDSSQMTVHSLSQSQTIIHESNNIHRLLPSNPIIHQDQFSTLYGPRPVLKYENVQYEGSSWNQVQNIQSTSQQSIMIKQEPESDNESDINNDDAEEYGQYEQFDEQVVQNYSGEIEENVQYEDSPWNHVQNTQTTSQQTINIKQEPESDNEPDINPRSTQESYHYGRFIEDKLLAFSQKTREAVQLEFFKIICKAHQGYYE
ncbi:Hypothetical protein CINCED_3A002867 [Cinara cedri]|nr:Hypothetical protein CINCED_3A002867 [Cinara cedri]